MAISGKPLMDRMPVPSAGIVCSSLSSDNKQNNTNGSEICEIHLPALVADTSDPTYIMLTKKNEAMYDDRKQIAKFLEMTTFGPTIDEINELDNDGNWGPESRAKYVRQQMDTNATSHREYFRKRANAKWTSSALAARSGHPCSPNSLWRKYTFIEQDAVMTDSTDDNGSYGTVTFETVPEEAGLVNKLYEADGPEDISGCGKCDFRNAINGDAAGHSGTGGYLFAHRVDDYIEWSINVDEAGDRPISFRYSLDRKQIAYHLLSIYVNDALVKSDYNFGNTGGWTSWLNSESLEVSLNVGLNEIKLALKDRDSGGGPAIDFLRVGKPPAVVIKSNGWARTVAKDGVGLMDEWGFNFTNGSSATFPEKQFPQPPGGQTTRYGRTDVAFPPNNKRGVLDIGNPPIFFTGYEQYLPDKHFVFTNEDVFVDTASQLFEFPIEEGQELLLRNGSTDPICGELPPFADERNAPIYGLLPNGEWLQWTPSILLEDNGPPINAAPSDLAKYTLNDGGGSVEAQSGGVVKCSNVPRSIFNEATCFLSMEESACRSNDLLARAIDYKLSVTSSNILKSNELGQRYVYAIRGLLMEDLEQHACLAETSRWVVEAGACAEPTQGLGPNTMLALEDAIRGASDINVYTQDITRTLPCETQDITTNNLHVQIEVDGECFT